MSRRALHTAVRDWLRSSLGYNEKTCDLTFDGRPQPRCGELFVSVHQAARRRGLFPNGFSDKYYGFFVTVTRRISVPFDRLGPDLLEEAESGLNDQVDAIANQVDEHQLDILTAANVIIGSTFAGVGDPRGFVEAPFYEDDGPARVVGADWFFAKDQPLSGVVTVIRFGGARRIQKFSDPDMS